MKQKFYNMQTILTVVLSNLGSANALFQQLDRFKNLCGLEIHRSKNRRSVNWVSKEQ